MRPFLPTCFSVLLCAVGCGSGVSGGSADGGGLGGAGNGGTGNGGAGNAAGAGNAGGSGNAAGAGNAGGAGNAAGAGNAGGSGGIVGTFPPGCIDKGAANVCARWKADRADLSEGTWSGNVGSCNPGDISANGRANALRLINLYRYMVGLPEATSDPTRNQKAQACALMMKAEGKLSHTPDTGWGCYSADGAEAAGKSNISTGSGVGAVDRYMRDNGNLTTMGHRRWIVSNTLGLVGLGSTDAASCMWVISGGGKATRKWTAWPPEGDVPFEHIDYIKGTGWTIQSSDITLNNATVKITDQTGKEMPVSVTVLQPNFGAKNALLIQLSGWAAQAGSAYAVQVSGSSEPICYVVNVVNCG